MATHRPRLLHQAGTAGQTGLNNGNRSGIISKARLAIPRWGWVGMPLRSLGLEAVTCSLCRRNHELQVHSW